MNRYGIFLLCSLCLSLVLVGCQGQEKKDRQIGNNETTKAKQENEVNQVEGEAIPPEVDFALKEMEEKEIGQDYARVHQYYFDETVLHILYERKLTDGWTDAFDFYDVFYDTEKLALENLIRKGEKHNF